MASQMGLIGFVIVVAAAALFQCSVAQTTYNVGDSDGWRVPSSGAQFYENWANGKTFNLGDILSFTFNPSAHDVAEVSKADFDSCSGSNAKNLYNSSPANITLNSAGEHYFICTVSGHCSNGQKLAITVVSSTTGSSEPSPAPTAGSTPPPAGSTPPPSPSSAFSLAAGFGAFTAALTAFFL